MSIRTFIAVIISPLVLLFLLFLIFFAVRNILSENAYLKHQLDTANITLQSGIVFSHIIQYQDIETLEKRLSQLEVARYIKSVIDSIPAKMVFNPPETMKLGVKERIEFRVSTEATALLTEGLKGRGDPVVEQVKVSAFMKTKLLGDNFDIQDLSNPEQIIVKGETTEWSWDVVPLESGQQVMQLNVASRISIPGYADGFKNLPIIEKSVYVQANHLYSITRFWSKSWQWSISIIIIPLAVFLYNKRHSKRQRSGGSSKNYTDGTGP